MSLLTTVSAERRTQWTTFTEVNSFDTGFLVNKGIAIVTEEMLAIMLAENEYRGYRYLDEDGTYRIGYGIGDPDADQGYTEAEAYSEWIGYVRNAQKIVRAQLPIVGIPITVYDAMVSLYVDTGTWRRVEADEGTYDVNSALINRSWILVADMLARGNVNPQLRQKEAAIVQLGSYAGASDRRQLRTAGLQFMRIQYTNGISNEFEKKQAEFAYFRELDAYLPGMSSLRQRRVATQARP